jgi:hypothetical protein
MSPLGSSRILKVLAVFVLTTMEVLVVCVACYLRQECAAVAVLFSVTLGGAIAAFGVVILRILFTEM